MDVLRRRPASRHTVILRAGRNPEVAVENRVRERLFPGRLFGEDQPDHRAIRLDLACRLGVVDLQEDFRASRNLLDRARLPYFGLNARGEPAEQHSESELTAAIELRAGAAVRQLAAIVVDRHVRPEPQQEPLFVKDWFPVGAPLLYFLSGRNLLRLGAIWRWQNGGDDVMDDPAVAGARFSHLHVFVFSEAGIYHEVLILVWPIGIEGELFRHLQ